MYITAMFEMLQNDLTNLFRKYSKNGKNKSYKVIFGAEMLKILQMSNIFHKL